MEEDSISPRTLNFAAIQRGRNCLLTYRKTFPKVKGPSEAWVVYTISPPFLCLAQLVPNPMSSLESE